MRCLNVARGNAGRVPETCTKPSRCEVYCFWLGVARVSSDNSKIDDFTDHWQHAIRPDPSSVIRVFLPLHRLIRSLATLKGYKQPGPFPVGLPTALCGGKCTLLVLTVVFTRS